MVRRIVSATVALVAFVLLVVPSVWQGDSAADPHPSEQGNPPEVAATPSPERVGPVEEYVPATLIGATPGEARRIARPPQTENGPTATSPAGRLPME